MTKITKLTVTTLFTLATISTAASANWWDGWNNQPAKKSIPAEYKTIGNSKNYNKKIVPGIGDETYQDLKKKQMKKVKQQKIGETEKN